MRTLRIMKGRLVFLDYARVVAMFLVILGHMETGGSIRPDDYIYAFHMPLFFLVSGMLHKYTGEIQWKKYLKTLIVPFCFFNFFWMLIYLLDLPQMKIDFSGIVERLKNDYIIHGPTWFLLSLFYCRIILDYSCKFPLYALLFWIVCFLLLDKVFLLKYIWLAQAVMAMPFYYVGWRYKDRIIHVLDNKYAVMCGLICFCFLLVITTWQGRVSMKRIVFGLYTIPRILAVSFFYLNAFCGSFMVLFLSTLFRYKKIVTNYADALITTLCVQYIFIHLCLALFGKYQPLYFTFFESLLVLILCYYVHLLIKKTCPFIIGKS